MTDHTLRGKAAVVGVGETRYYKRGAAPDSEFKMALEAIMLACVDAGVDVEEIDGLVSYADDRNDPPRIAAALKFSATAPWVGVAVVAAREAWPAAAAMAPVCDR